MEKMDNDDFKWVYPLGRDTPTLESNDSKLEDFPMDARGKEEMELEEPITIIYDGTPELVTDSTDTQTTFYSNPTDSQNVQRTFYEYHPAYSLDSSLHNFSRNSLNSVRFGKEHGLEDFEELIRSLPSAPHTRNNSEVPKELTHRRNHSEISLPVIKTKKKFEIGFELEVNQDEELARYERIGGCKPMIDINKVWYITPIVGDIAFTRSDIVGANKTDICGVISLVGAYAKLNQDIIVIYSEVDDDKRSEISRENCNSPGKNYIHFSCIADEIFNITLTDLLPDKQYELIWYIAGTYICIYKHYIDTRKLAKINFVCNNNYQFDTKNSLWNKLGIVSRYSTNNGSVCTMHIGNQVYGDDIFPTFVVPFSGSVLDPKRAYMNLYKETFRDSGNREILSNTRNLMSWNDHEIKSNFIYDVIPENSRDKLVADGAYEAYRSVQESLHVRSNVLFVKERCWMKQYAPDKLMISIENVSTDLAMTEIINIIYVGILKYKPQNMIIMFSNAPIPSPQTRLPKSRKYHSMEDICILYDYLLKWVADPGEVHELFVIGGGYGYGMLGSVMRKDVSFKIALNGPISDQPGIRDYFAARTFSKSKLMDIGQDIKLYVLESRARRNFVTLNLCSGHKLVPHMNFSDHVLPRDKWRYVKSLFKR